MRWGISLALLVVGGYVILGNLWLSIRWYFHRQSASLVPFVGGILTAVGLALSPSPLVGSCWWLALFADPGCALLGGAVLWDQLRKGNRRHS